MERPPRKSCPGTGKLFVISAPSGCGKTTLGRRLLDDNIGLYNSISMTTRPPRPGEKNGVDYRFVSRKHFQELIKAGAFLEYEENFGHLYGTPKKFIRDSLKKGRSVLLSIDVKGAMKVRRAYGAKSVLIFILPPSIAALKNRLHLRMSDGPDVIAARLRTAKEEVAYKNRYDHRVINDRLDTAYRKLKKIVMREAG